MKATMKSPGPHDEPDILTPPWVHGFMYIAWDDAALPAGFWAVMERLPNGCWVDIHKDREAKYRETVVMRLLRLMPEDVLAIVPTCANVRCANPSHLCVTKRTVLSTKEAPSA